MPDWRDKLRDFLALQSPPRFPKGAPPTPVEDDVTEDDSSTDLCDCDDCTYARIHNLQPFNPFVLEVTRR